MYNNGDFVLEATKTRLIIKYAVLLILYIVYSVFVIA